MNDQGRRGRRGSNAHPIERTIDELASRGLGETVGELQKRLTADLEAFEDLEARARALRGDPEG